MSLRFPIYFLSYDEENAEENWFALKERFAHAKRIHGIAGIQRAHQICAETCETSHFFVVDGDNQIRQDFSFTIAPDLYHPESIHVWRCKNPVNDLVYGYGAIKLFPKSPFERVRMQMDLSTGLGVPYKIIPMVASETHFHSSPHQAWRGAFREAAKLARQVDLNPNDSESLQRLNAWCSLGENRPNGKWVILGALEGRAFARTHSGDSRNLEKINDFDWLKTVFIEKFQQDGRLSEIYPA